MSESRKIEFSLGGTVSPNNFFKSEFARSFEMTCKDTKSLDYSDKEAEISNILYSSLNESNSSLKQMSVAENKPELVEELEILRKQCKQLKKDNEDLELKLTNSHSNQVQIIDNACLKNQVISLQWQLKQSESNRQMYESLMEQVAQFLDRCKKSLDIIDEKTNGKSNSKHHNRTIRSRSVHEVNSEMSSSRASSTTSTSTSSSDSSRRWTQNNDDATLIYNRPSLQEVRLDDVPAKKLSQEAFRLLRTVQSLLMMREPDLTRLTHTQDLENEEQNDNSLPVQTDDFANSTVIQDSSPLIKPNVRLERSLMGNERNRSNSKPLLRQSLGSSQLAASKARSRKSLDASSLNSGSSKTTEDEDTISKSSYKESSRCKHIVSTSTPNKKTKDKKEKKEKKELKFKSFKEWAFGTTDRVPQRPKLANSPCSADDESGFSSMSSFQEVGLPNVNQGCHTEIGLPEVRDDKVRHRRWSSTPAEIRSIFKRHSGSFTNGRIAETQSVWV